MSNIYTLENDLDLKQNLNVYAICKQFDTLYLVLSIYNDSLVADLTSYNVRLKAMKFDNIPLIQENNCTINGNIVTIIADDQLTTTSGKTLIELDFINKTTLEKKATFNLVLNVVASTLEVNRTISTATYTLLEELENKLDQAGDFLENVNKAIEANNNLKTGIITATTLKTDLDNTINTGNTINSELEGSITEANTSKTNLENENTEAVGNINTLTTKNTEASSNIANLTTLNQNATILEQNLQTLTTENNKATQNTSDLTTQNSSATQNINDLTSKNSTAETNKANLDNANTQAQANIDVLNQLGDVTGIAQDVTNLKTEVETARNGEVNLDTRLDGIDTLVASHTVSLSEKANDTDSNRTTTSKTVTGAINELNNVKANKDISLSYKSYVATNGDLNTITTTGFYNIADATNITNKPTVADWSILEVLKTDAYVRQIISNSVSGVNYIRTRTDTTWSAWKQIATTETAIVTLLNGWTTTIGDTKISKNGNQVTVNLCLTGGVTTNGTTIGTIPSGFRPSTYKFVWGKIENASYVGSDAVIMVDPNGAMYFNGSPNGNTRLTFNFSFTI